MVSVHSEKVANKFFEVNDREWIRVKTPSDPTAKIWSNKDTGVPFKSQKYLLSILNLKRSVNQMKIDKVLSTLLMLYRVHGLISDL